MTESIFLVSIQDIIRCEVTGNYTKFFLSDQKPVLVSCTLKEFDEMLIEYKFFRVHQSHLVNLEHIVCIDNADDGVLILSDGKNCPVSTRKKDALIKVLGEL